MIETNSTTEDSKSRMIRNIIRLWGVRNVDELDPLVKILIDALSGEVSKINQEIHAFEKRILDKMALVFTPILLGISNVAHAVAHAMPNELDEIISSTTTVSYTSKQLDHSNQETVYFTPVTDIHLFDTHVRYLVAHNELYECNGLEKVSKNKSEKYFHKSNDLWIGLKVKPGIHDLNGISFYFSYSDPAFEKLFSTFLKTSEWYCMDTKIIIENGFFKHNSNSCLEIDESMDQDPMFIVEREIFKYYNDRFITVLDQTFSHVDLEKTLQKYPEELIQLFPSLKLDQLDESVLWIHIKTSIPISEHFFKSLSVHTNAFPVLNRKLKEITYRLKDVTNIIPLRTSLNEFFISMISLVDSSNHSYKKAPYIEVGSSAIDSYVIRRDGAERMDSRSSKECLQHVLTLIRDESSAFASYGTDSISNILKEIDRLSTKLEQRLAKNNQVKKDYSYYLLLQQFHLDETFFIKFWVSNGVLANKIPVGTNLIEAKGSQLKKNSIYLLTQTIGGKEGLTESNQIDAFKYSMLSHGRIVTAEDIKAFCRLEIGRYIDTNITIQKGLMISDHPEEGLVRCVEVLLKRKRNPAEEHDAVDWDTELKLLQSKIELRSALNLNVVLKLLE